MARSLRKAPNLASNADVVSGQARGNNGATSANLRGQGAAATLVLLNGRRIAAHGLNGGIVDLNVMAVGAALEDLALDSPVTFLTHQLAWTLGVGPIVEHLGAKPAGRDSAHHAFAEGHHVVVFPGGDLDAAKKFSDRNDITFDAWREVGVSPAVLKKAGISAE